MPTQSISAGANDEEIQTIKFGFAIVGEREVGLKSARVVWLRRLGTLGPKIMVSPASRLQHLQGSAPVFCCVKNVPW